MQMLGNLGIKRNFVFSAPTPCPKNVLEPLTVPISEVLLCYAVRICASFSLFCIWAQGTLATQLLVVNEKIIFFMLLNFVSPPTFSIVLRHWVGLFCTVHCRFFIYNKMSTQTVSTGYDLIGKVVTTTNSLNQTSLRPKTSNLWIHKSLSCCLNDTLDRRTNCVYIYSR